MKITTVGVDIAKTVFQIHGVNEQGAPVLKKQLKRGQVLSLFATLTPCVIGMEACRGAHHWARQLQKLGAYGQAYGTAICEAVRQDQ